MMHRSIVLVIALWGSGTAAGQQPNPYDPWQPAKPTLAINAHVVKQPLPVAGRPHGLAVAGETLWLGIDDRLLHLRATDLSVIGDFDAPRGIVDLSADDRFLFALTDKGVVHVVDPEAGRTVRQIPVTPKDGNSPSFRGLACDGEALLVVVEGGVILSMSKHDGEVLGEQQAGMKRIRLLASADIACDGDLFTPIAVRQPSGVWSPRVFLQREPRGVAVLGPEYLVLVGEDEEGRASNLYRLRPGGITETVNLRIECLDGGREVVDAAAPGGVRREGRRLAYLVGPKKLRDLDGVRRELRRIYGDEETWYTDTSGTSRPLPVSLDPLNGVVLGDVAEVARIAFDVGFREIFGVPDNVLNAVAPR